MKERNLDREAPEENSSSQNVKQSILKIRRGAGRSKTEILLSGGSSFFVTERMVLQNDLREGIVLTEISIETLRIRGEYIFARRKALELLGSREHSVYQLKQKLIHRKFSPGTVERVLEELTDEGLLSNVRFMEAWLTSRLRKHPEGYRALFAGLTKAGIPSSEIRDYLLPFMERVDSDLLLEEAASKIMKNRKITKEKLIRSLYSRGFETARIIRFIEQNYTDIP